ncbi:MAG: CHRD domain-containing protein [Pseudomonadota bacterium]
MTFLQKMTKLAMVPVASAMMMFGAVAAHAEVLTFTSNLDGSQEVPTPNFLFPTGVATLSVDTMAETLSFSLSVDAINTFQLNDGLVAAPVGPVHLHNAGFGQNGPIVVPFAFNTTDYQNTANGFDLNVTNLAYSDAVALSGSTLSFSDFVAALNSGLFYINVHTDEFPGGQIRGQLASAGSAVVPVPGAAILFVTAMAGAAGIRRKRRTA